MYVCVLFCNREVKYLLYLIGGLIIILTVSYCLSVNYVNDNNAAAAVNLAHCFPRCVM